LTAGVIAAIVTAVIILLLSIPLELGFCLEVRERSDFHVTLRWFFGLGKKQFGRRKKRAKKRTGRGWRFLDLLRIRGLLPVMLRLLRDVSRRIRIRELRVDFRIGLDDPADTALFAGVLWLPVLILGLISPDVIRVQPAFDDGAVFQGRADVLLRVQPIQLVPAVARFGFSRAGLRLPWVFLSGRWKREKG
jgi:hypothetical protein